MSIYSRILDENDLNDIQDLLEKNSEFFEKNYNRIPLKSESVKLFENKPKDSLDDDNVLIGIFNELLELIGCFKIIRNFPFENKWFLELFIIEPNYRNDGIGTFIYENTENWSVDLGAEFLWTNILNTNIEGYKFFKKMGFKESKDKFENNYFEYNEGNVFLEKEIIRIVI